MTTGLLWAVLAIKLKVALAFASAGTIVWYRFVFAFVALTIFLNFRHRKEIKDVILPPWPLLLAGACLAFNYFGYMKGIEYTSPSQAQIAIQVGPLILILVGLFYFKERTSIPQILGFLIAFLGFAIFYFEQSTFSAKSNPATHLLWQAGYFWILAAALTWTCFAVLSRMLVSRFHPQAINWVIYGVSAILLLPLVQWKDFYNWSFGNWILMTSLGLNTVLAYGLLAEAFSRLPTSLTSLIISLNPLLTVFFMYLLGGLHLPWLPYEVIGSLGVVGALLVVVGAILASRPKRA